MKKFLFTLILMMWGSSLLSACGQTGALYLPQESVKPTIDNQKHD